MLRPTPVLLVTLLAAACTPPPASSSFLAGEIVDLSHPYDETTIFWPTSERFRLETVADGITPDGFYYAANNIFTAEHGGTHLDAPIHFARDGQSVDRVPLARLIGAAVVVDVTDRARQDATYQTTVADIEEAERRDGRIPGGAILLIRTGFSQRWPDAERYLGTAERGEAAIPNLRFPGLHPEAAAWLVEQRDIAAIGIDTASIDYGPSTLFEAHRTLAARDVPIFENLTALDRLPARGAHVIALPMKITGGSGGPLRAIAIVP